MSRRPRHWYPQLDYTPPSREFRGEELSAVKPHACEKAASEALQQALRSLRSAEPPYDLVAVPGDGRFVWHYEDNGEAKREEVEYSVLQREYHLLRDVWDGMISKAGYVYTNPKWGRDVDLYDWCTLRAEKHRRLLYSLISTSIPTAVFDEDFVMGTNISIPLGQIARPGDRPLTLDIKVRNFECEVWVGLLTSEHDSIEFPYPQLVGGEMDWVDDGEGGRKIIYGPSVTIGEVYRHVLLLWERRHYYVAVWALAKENR